MMNSSAIGFIPARYGSTRLPAKPLADIHGRPMIWHVWSRAARAAELRTVYVATDDERIARACEEFGAPYVLTDPALPSGSDRVWAAAVAQQVEAEILVNIQGDEPLLQPEIIDSMVRALRATPWASVSTPVTPLTNPEELAKPSVVKVALAEATMNGLYFSRSPIPFDRDGSGAVRYYKHLGLYAWRRDALREFVSAPPSPLELAEQLEQLRLLELGHRIVCVHTEASLHAVDTPDDLEYVRSVIAAQ
jgi:3-deoxy-manno-octulosonate cytidylyltransferase (CMP-KDO synthetase)